MKPRSPRRGRLSRSAEFERVYRQGKSFGNRQLVLYAFPNESAGQGPRVGLSVSRKVGGAVERNRVKRLLREAFARLEGDVQGGHDIVLVARPQALQLAERGGLDGMAASLAELLGRAGMRHEGQQSDARVEREADPRSGGGELQPSGSEDGLE